MKSGTLAATFLTRSSYPENKADMLKVVEQKDEKYIHGYLNHGAILLLKLRYIFFFFIFKSFSLLAKTILTDW